jgi:PAS domain S-box-containing protein
MFELQSFSYRRRRRDGSWADLEVAGFVELAPHAPNVAMLYGIGRDTTEEVAAESALKDLLLSTSFDLRLNAQNILAAAALLAERPDIMADEAALFLAQMLHTSSNLLHNQVSGVIEMRKLERGEITVRNEAFSIRTLLGDVMQMCRMSLQHGTAAVAWADEAEVALLPDSVEGDAQHIAQIVQNLLQNALKFCAGSAVRVRATLERQGDGRQAPSTTQLRVDVSDQGVGLTAEDCLRVFEAYEKAPVAEGGGTGLGLYTSRAFARLLGGDLTVVSRKGHGSTFTMRVPVRVLGLGGDSAPIAGADAAVAPVAAGPPMPLPAPAASGAAPLPGAESDLVETMLQRLMEHASDIFAVLDPLPNAPAGPESLRLSFVSPNIERVLGWRPTDLIGRSCTDFMYAPDVLMHMVALQELFSGGLTSMQGMRRMVCANGSLRWMHVDICMHDGALMCVARDATRQKATQKALNEFLLSTSHDLRTPVHSILTGTQLLGQRESVRGDAEAAFLLDAVKASCALLLGTISSVLDMRAIDAQELGARLSSTAPGSFSPTQLAADAVHTVCLGSGRPPDAIEWEPPAGLPERVEADVDRVTACLQHVLVTALTHCTAGKPRLSISCNAGDDDAVQLQARVALESSTLVPSGSSDDCERVFAPPSLGLHSARAYSRAMGGDLTLEANDDAKVFTLSLPVRLPVAGGGGVAAAGQESTHHAAASPHERDSKRIRSLDTSPPQSSPASMPAAQPRCLLVEDHALNRKLVSRLLESHGFTVDAACDGAEALRMLQASFTAAAGATPPPDLLLTDLSMPQMGGLELARRFRDFERSSQPPGAHLLIVALTAHVMEAQVAECYAAGCDAHLGKPLRADSIATLRARIEAPRASSDARPV